MEPQQLIMINFCHIAPTPHLDLTTNNGAHLLLAHLVEESEEYVEYYSKLNDGKIIILDNSAFERFKAGLEMYPSEKLIEMGKRVYADIIVMSDYPKQKSEVTISAARKLNREFAVNGFGSFFVPQSELGDIEDYIQAVDWALDQPNIRLIGLSILGCPIALGLDESPLAKRSDAYKMQRFLSRWKVLQILKDRGILDQRAEKRFHCLGMVDGPNEIMLLESFHDYIWTWDSSAAVWAGLNGIGFDNSPTGLVDGKYENEVDFHTKVDDNIMVNLARSNIQYINNLCGKND